MKSTNHLFKKYFYHSNENLIAIVENPHLYQKETVEVAKELLEGRVGDYKGMDVMFEVDATKTSYHGKPYLISVAHMP